MKFYDSRTCKSQEFRFPTKLSAIKLKEDRTKQISSLKFKFQTNSLVIKLKKRRKEPDREREREKFKLGA